jgi:hypothetical protein
MKLPPPEALLAGCVYLPRIIAKARALSAGLLPEGYVTRFGTPDSVDGLFLAFCGLSAQQITEAAALNDAFVERWFGSLPGTSAQRIKEWNHIARNLGRVGFPMAERLPIALSTKYGHLANRGIETIFEMLNADEEPNQSLGPTSGTVTRRAEPRVAPFPPAAPL